MPSTHLWSAQKFSFSGQALLCPGFMVADPIDILLVEDSEDDAFFFRWIVRKCQAPANITHVPDGASAIDHLAKVKSGSSARPHVVFLDLKLPSFSGFEVLEWVQRQTWPEQLRIIVLSGSEHVSDVERTRLLGAAGYLVKPVSPEQLKEQLKRTRGGVEPEGTR
jgi:CheY-like chemotaxis protein